MHEPEHPALRSAKAPRLRGFTVTELIVVVAVIAVVIAIVIPSVGKIRASARTVKCLSNQRQITMACYSYAVANASRLVSSRTDGGTGYAGAQARIDGQNVGLGSLGWNHWISRAFNAAGHIGVSTVGGQQFETPAAITTSVLYPYLGDIQVYISPDEPTNPAALSASGTATRIRSYSLNSLYGTTRVDELVDYDNSFTATMYGQKPNIDQFSCTTIGQIKLPARMLSTIVEDDTVAYNNQGWVVLADRPQWVDWPAAWRPDAITMSYADGSTETYALVNKQLPILWETFGHNYVQPPDASAGIAVDWKFFRDRLNPWVIPNSTYGFSSN